MPGRVWRNKLTGEVGDDTHWTLRAQCAAEHLDPERFFPDENRVTTELRLKPSPEVMRAKIVCRRCTVREDCWSDSLIPARVDGRLVYDFVGIRAGQTGKERRALVKEHGEEAFKRSEERLGFQINQWGTKED